MSKVSGCALMVVVMASGSTLAQPGAGLHVYFGNLHSHTSYSDGSGTPSQAFEHARSVAKLDFLAITEHNHKDAESGATDDRRDGILIATNHALYTADLIPAARAATVDGSFVGLYGQEFSSISKGNHANVFDIDQVITAGNGKFDELMTWLDQHKDSASQPAIMQFNHPKLFHNTSVAYGADDFPSQAQWVSAVGAHACLLEVFNGPAMAKTAGNRPAEVAEPEYLYYLSLGFHMAPTADQDNHYFTWGSATDARTAVIAPELTKSAILTAIRQRHVYATEDKNVRVIFTVNGHLCGDRLAAPAPGSELDVQYSIQDPDDPVAGYSVEVYRGTIGGELADVVDRFTVDGDTPPEGGKRSDITYTGGRQYVLFRLTQQEEHSDDDVIWTAPVWFDADAPAGGDETAAASLRMVQVLPNPDGDDVQNESVTLRNSGGAAMPLTGWRLRDAAQTEWNLDADGAIGPQQTLVIVRHGRPMSLNNNGDTIELVDPSGQVVQRFTYGHAVPGQPIDIP